MRTYLGVDGGGSKTAFLLINEAGHVIAEHIEGSAYYPQVGVDGVRENLLRGCNAVSAAARTRSQDFTFSFFGIPAYGEDSRLQSTLDEMPAGAMLAGRYRCGNDMVCAWAGSLAGLDGINVVAGTGSIAYGEYQTRSARAGGWGEVFSDEGSAYWIAREGLSLFSRMSDGREARGPLHGLIREHFDLAYDLDVCGAIYGQIPMPRSDFSLLAKIVARAAADGDEKSRMIFHRGAVELAAMIEAVRRQLQVPCSTPLPVSYAGSIFSVPELCLQSLQRLLAESPYPYLSVEPRLPPQAGAAIYAARLSGNPLQDEAIHVLESHF